MIKLGDLDFTSIKQGSTDIIAVYLASEKIWPVAQPSTDFDVRLTLTGGTIENHTYSSGTIPNNEFYQRYDIVGVEMGSGITSIGDGAFYRCSGITQVEIGESVTHIGLYAFWYCTSVSSATLGNSLASVDEYGLAFYSSAITSIVLPSTLTSLGNNSMRGCANLTAITCNATNAPTLGTLVFLDNPSQGTLYVPSGSDYSSWIGTSATSGDKLASGWTIVNDGASDTKYYVTVNIIGDSRNDYLPNEDGYSEGESVYLTNPAHTMGAEYTVTTSPTIADFVFDDMTGDISFTMPSSDVTIDINVQID